MNIVADIAREIRYAFRALARTPRVTSAMIVTVGLGIGATTAIFSVLNAVLLQPLPYADPDRLVRIVEHVPAAESPSGTARRRTGMDQEEFDWWRQRSQTLSHMAMLVGESATLRTEEGTDLLTGARVTPSLFPMRSIPPLLGRGLLPSDERPDANVVVISESTWRRYLQADPDVIDETVVLNGQTYVIVGVMPQTFGDQQFWLPLFEPSGQSGRTVVAGVSARLRDGVSLETANAEANVLGLQLRGLTQEPGELPRFEIVRELDEIVGPVVPALRVLAVAAVAVLLIVCTNVANLLLVRSTNRRHEIGVRRSLGATSGRIVRQVLTESFVLAMFAGFAGIVLAYWGVEVLKDLTALSLSRRFSGSVAIPPRMEDVSLDPLVLAFAAGVSILTGALFGILPALRVSRFGEIGRSSAMRSTTLLTYRRLRSALATVQIAFAMALLVSAGLLMHSFQKLARVDVGFDARNALSFDLITPGEYSAERRLEVAEEITRRLQVDSRVSDVGFIDIPPLQPGINVPSDFVPPGYTAQQIWEEQADLPFVQKTQGRYVSPGYLSALGARLVSGSWFDREPGSPGGMTALVSLPFAQKYFAGQSPVGATVMTGRFGALTILGVVDSIPMFGIDAEPEPVVFLEARQALNVLQASVESGREREVGRSFLTPGPSGGIAFAVRSRSTSNPFALVGDIRLLLAEIDPAVALDNAVPMEEILSGLTTRERFYAVLLSAFGSVAAFLALVGVYGVLSYVVVLRTNEIGIRMALGASRTAVLGMVLREGSWMVAIGVGAGLMVAAWLGRYLEGMLFGITSLDITTYALVAASFVAVALFAVCMPARRAAKLDPLVALRYE